MSKETANEVYSGYIGACCVVRSVAAGVYYGIIEAVDGQTVRMKTVRNIWRWKGANCLADVAEAGIKEGLVSRVVPSMVLTGVCQIIPLSEAAMSNLDDRPSWIAL